jgi:hypothetical protein
MLCPRVAMTIRVESNRFPPTMIVQKEAQVVGEGNV